MQYYNPFLQWIDHQKEHMINLVTTWSNINSHAMNLDGLAKQMQALRAEFSQLAGELQELTLPPQQHIDNQGRSVVEPLGKALLVTKRPNAQVRIFLSGHMDTVFHKNSPFQVAKRTDENTIVGPGVCDMKGGLVILLMALHALEKSPFANTIGWEVLITPDEEIGSPGSKAIFERAAKRNHIGLLFEPSFPDGAFVSERAGSMNLVIVVHGKSAHVGRDFEKGKNAIFAAAPLIVELEQINSPDVTCSVGEVSSGQGFNIVPDTALIKINIRSPKKEALLEAKKKIDTLVKAHASKRDGITMELHEMSVRHPKESTKQTEKLFSWLEASLKEFNEPLKKRATRGVSDGNILAQHGLDNIDSLGAIGGEIHTTNEYLLVDSLTKRAKLLALLLMKIANSEFDVIDKAPPIAL